MEKFQSLYNGHFCSRFGCVLFSLDVNTLKQLDTHCDADHQFQEDFENTREASPIGTHMVPMCFFDQQWTMGVTVKREYMWQGKSQNGTKPKRAISVSEARRNTCEGAFDTT